MILFPAIDLKDGQCVRLKLGDMDQATVYNPDPAAQTQLNENTRRLKLAIAELPEKLRTALMLAEYEGMPQSEISLVVNCSVKAVETRIYRARHLLRGKLGDLLNCETSNSNLP